MGWIDKLTGKKPAVSASAQGAGKPSPKILKVSDYISTKNIAFFPAGPSKKQVLGNLIGSLDLPDPSAALTAILAREEAGSTVIGPGLALPHARLAGISRIAAAVGICPTGVVEPRLDGGPIKLFVLFLGPADNMKEHLAFLASVSALFQVEGLVDALTQLNSPDAVLEKIRQTEKTLQG